MKLIWEIDGKEAELFIVLNNGRKISYGFVNVFQRTDHDRINYEKRCLEEKCIEEMCDLVTRYYQQ